jgi:hypothetical protein
MHKLDIQLFRRLSFRREEKSFNKRYRIGVACSVEKHSTGINGLTQYNQHENPLIP